MAFISCVLSFLRSGEKIREMLFRILFTCLCRLADFLTDSLPLVILIVLDGIEKSLALILGKFGVVHVLIPVFLDAALGSCRKGLGNFCPAAAGVPHLFQPQLLGRSPGSIRATLLNWRRLRRRVWAIRSRSRRRDGSLLSD